MSGIFHSAVRRNGSVFEQDNALVIHTDEIVLMGNHDDSRALLVEAHEQIDYLEAHMRVNIARRLVRYDKIGVIRKGAGKSHTLLLAAGELGGIAIHLVRQPDYVEHERDALLNLVLLRAGDAHGERHVVEHGHLGDQAKILEYYAQPAAKIGYFAAGKGAQILIFDYNFSMRGHFLTHHELEEGAFSGAGRADYKDEFALVYLDIDMV